MHRSLLLGATLVVAVLTGLPAAASADTYTVFACRGPLGAVVPTTGWAGGQSAAGAATSNTCATGGPLSAALLEAHPVGGRSAFWQFAAPADTRIVRIAAQRATGGLAKSNKTADVGYDLTAENAGKESVLEQCAPSSTSSCIADLTQPIDRQGLDAGWVRFRVACLTADTDVCSAPLRLDVAQAAVGLKDVLAPTVTNVAVADDGMASGTLRLSYDAVDRGGGVYRTVLKVDGQPVRTTSAGGPTCADAAPSNGDPYEFTAPVPCPLVAKGLTTSVAVGDLTPGPHGVEVDVEDAAGNTTSVYGPRPFPQANGGTHADVKAKLRMWFVKTHKQAATSRFGTRVVVRGRLRDRHDKGIQGARIDVYHVVNGKRRLVKTGLKTRAKGRLTLILPMNVDTRTIEFAYRAVRPGAVTSSRHLNLTVKRHGKVFRRPAK